MEHQVHRAIAAARTLRGQTQAEFARSLSDHTGDQWSRGMVANLESGRRTIDVEILMAIAEIHDLPVDFYLYGPAGTLSRNEHSGRYLGWPGRGLRDLLPSVEPEPALAAGF